MAVEVDNHLLRTCPAIHVEIGVAICKALRTRISSQNAFCKE